MSQADEIDLRPFIFSLLRRWYWVLGAALLGATVVAITILIQPRHYEATALLLFQGERTQLLLDERIESEDALLSDRITRRGAWIALARSEGIARLLPQEVLQQVMPENGRPEDLAGSIAIDTEGDLISLSAIRETPQQAQLLANSWGQAFAAHVNTLTTGNETGLLATQQQIADAEARYEAAQAALATFLGSSQMTELDNQIANLSTLLEGNLHAKEAQYTSQITATTELRFLLEDAETLRAQVATDATVTTSDALAVLALRLRAVGGTAALQLQVDNLSAANVEPEELVSGLGTLITGVEAQIAAREGQIADLNTAMLTNAPVPGSLLTPEEFQALYRQMNTLTQAREALEGERLNLLQERTVALDTLDVLRRKASEQAAATTQPDIEVIFAGEASLPVKATNRGLVRSTIIGGLMGGMLGVLAALLAGLRTSWSTLRQARPLDRPADTPSYS